MIIHHSLHVFHFAISSGRFVAMVFCTFKTAAIEWLTFTDARMANYAAMLLKRFTGDRCYVHIDGPEAFRVIRIDPSGKEV